jgi:hypothetical protein
MEAVSAVVEAAVATARVHAVAMRRVRRVRLHPATSKEGQGEQGQSQAGSEKERQMREHLASAPP